MCLVKMCSLETHSYDCNASTLRPSHLKIPGGPKLARAALSRWAIDGPCALCSNVAAKRGYVCLLFGG